jgi:hypothetical protein
MANTTPWRQGKDANAAGLDRQSPQMTQWRIATGLATTAFLFTCEAGTGSRGATLAELHLAAARPEIDFATIPGVVLQMKERIRGLLAAENVDTNRERHNLSKTQVTELQTENSTAAKGVRQQIPRAYRHTAWGGSNGEPLKALDMGQLPASARAWRHGITGASVSRESCPRGRRCSPMNISHWARKRLEALPRPSRCRTKLDDARANACGGRRCRGIPAHQWNWPVA